MKECEDSLMILDHEFPAQELQALNKELRKSNHGYDHDHDNEYNNDSDNNSQL